MIRSTISFFAVLTLVAGGLFTPASARAESLGEMMRDSGFDKVMGKWVDRDFGGERVALTFSWRLKDHAVGMSSKTGDRTTEAMVGLDPKSGDVVYGAFDSKGGVALGKWGEQDGKVVLDGKHTDADGEERSFRITYNLLDDDTLSVGVTIGDTGESFDVVLVRVKAKE